MAAPAPPLVLLASSGLAREVLAAVAVSGSWRVVGILDDDESQHDQLVDGVPVCGSIDSVTDHPNAHLLICAGAGRSRARIRDRLDRVGITDDRFATVVHPSACPPPGCRVGVGSILLAQVAMTCAVEVGRHVVAMPQVTLTHDDQVKDYVTLAAGVSLGGRVVVERRAYLGMNSSVRQGLRVGADATLGMGAALLSDVPPGETWVGVPARRLDQGSVR